MSEDNVRSGLFPLYGKWFLDTNEPVISLNLGSHEDAYFIPLDQWNSAEGVVRWLMHYGNKRGLESAELGDFLKSVTFLFGEEPLSWSQPELKAVKVVSSTPLPGEERRPSENANGFAFRSVAQGLDEDARTLRERSETGRFVVGARGEALLREKP